MTRFLVVEADGGSRGNPGPAAYGAVVRDGETGRVLVEVAETIGEADLYDPTANGIGFGWYTCAMLLHPLKIRLVEDRLRLAIVAEDQPER